jgi:hypothetical protein
MILENVPHLVEVKMLILGLEQSYPTPVHLDFIAKTVFNSILATIHSLRRVCLAM